MSQTIRSWIGGVSTFSRRETKLPRWSAPFVGVLVGAGFAAKHSLTEMAQGRAFAPVWPIIAAGAGVGFVGGMFVWLLDRPATPREALPDALATATYSEADLRALRLGPSKQHDIDIGVSGRFYSYMALGFCWLPMFGLWMTILAFMTHRKHGKPTGWALRGALILSVLMILALLVLVASPK